MVLWGLRRKRYYTHERWNHEADKGTMYASNLLVVQRIARPMGPGRLKLPELRTNGEGAKDVGWQGRSCALCRPVGAVLFLSGQV